MTPSALSNETQRAIAIIHWVFSADGTKGERSMADEAINKISDPTFMPLSPSTERGETIEGWPEHASPLPWKYVNTNNRPVHGMADWIEDAYGSVVVDNVGHIDGPAICGAVNRRAALPATGAGKTGWHDVGYLMSIIDAAIEDGFDPDEDGPLLDEIRAELASPPSPSGGEPEPVAVGWRWRHSGGPWRFLDNGEMPDDRDAYITSQPGYEVAPVFASPPKPSEAMVADIEMARHWIDRYAAGIDEEPQMRRIIAALSGGAK